MGIDILDVLFTVVAAILVIPIGVVVLPVAAIVLLVRWLWKRSHPAKVLGDGGAQAYAFLEEGATAEAVARTANGYVDDAVLGPHAQQVITTFEMAERRRKGIISILEEEFGTNSLTWDKFSTPVEVAMDGILHNAIQIVNRIQAFDSKDYQRMGRIQAAGGYNDDSTETKRLEVMRSTLDEMGDIQSANDRLLSELERLQVELGRMSGAGYDTETDEIAAEIAKLAEETKYYYDN